MPTDGSGRGQNFWPRQDLGQNVVPELAREFTHGLEFVPEFGAIARLAFESSELQLASVLVQTGDRSRQALLTKNLEVHFAVELEHAVQDNTVQARVKMRSFLAKRE